MFPGDNDRITGSMSRLGLPGSPLHRATAQSLSPVSLLLLKGEIA